MRMLVVDDEKVLVKGIKFNLEHEGYTVDTANDGEEAVALVRENHYDLIIMDIMMPKVDGLSACRQIREFSSVPVIMLTARGDNLDKLVGFESGADDYLTKPFDVLELKARIRAILRRAAAQTPSDDTGEEKPLVCGPLSLDPLKRRMTVGGEAVELTAKEFDVLELLMRHPGRVFGRESLLRTVWGYEVPGDIRTVDVHIRRLREKIEPNPAEPIYLLTKWAVGYYFRE